MVQIPPPSRNTGPPFHLLDMVHLFPLLPVSLDPTNLNNVLPRRSGPAVDMQLKHYLFLHPDPHPHPSLDISGNSLF